MNTPEPASPRAGKTLENISRFTQPRPLVDERFVAGKALREKLPREAHAVYQPDAARADPIDILQAQNATRLQPLVPVRHARMLASPFAFLRGSAAVMAADLAATHGFERCDDDETGLEAAALALLDVERRRMQRRARLHATVTTGSARVIAI